MKDNDLGRSPDGDGLSSPTEPVSAVSALRASIPSAMAERKAVSSYLRTLTIRSYLNMQKVPNWKLLTILRHKWMMAAYSIAAKSIEHGEHHGTQEGWLVRLEDGLFFAGEARQTVSASGIEARSDETAQQAQPEGQEPGPKGDAQTPPTGDDNV